MADESLHSERTLPLLLDSSKFMSHLRYIRFMPQKFFSSSILLLMLLLVPSMVWILTDRHVWPWDQAWYGEVTIDLWVNMSSGLPGWWNSMLHALGAKPPAVVWFGQILGPLSTTISWESTLLITVLLTNAISLVLLYSSLTRLFGHRSLAAWAGVLSVAASPLFIALNHQYFAEPAQLLVVCLFLWVTVYRNEMSRLRLVAWLCAATALGLSAKTTTPVYVFGFGLLILIGLQRRSHVKPPREVLGATLALVIAAASLITITLSWYIVNFKSVMEHAIQSSSGSVALDYGSAADLATKLSFWLVSLLNSMVLPDARMPILIVIGLLIVFFILRVVGRSKQTLDVGNNDSDRLQITIAAISQIVAVLLLFSLNINEETRYLLPLFPSVAVLLAFMIVEADVRGIAFAVIALLLLQWGFVCAFATVNIPLRVGTPWLMTRQTEGDQHDMISRLAKITCPRDDSDRTNVIGTEQSWLNANTMAFFSTQMKSSVGWRCYYTSLGYGETSPDRAWHRLNQEVKANYVVMLDIDRISAEANFLNRTNADVRRLIEASGVFATVPFSSIESITLFKRSIEPVPTINQ